MGVGWGTEQSSRMRRPEAAPTNPPRHAGGRVPPFVRPLPPLPLPATGSAFSLGARWRDGGGCCAAAACCGSCLLYPPLRFCLISRCDFGDLRFISRPLSPSSFFLSRLSQGSGVGGRQLAWHGWAAAEEDGEPNLFFLFYRWCSAAASLCFRLPRGVCCCFVSIGNEVSNFRVFRNAVHLNSTISFPIYIDLIHSVAIWEVHYCTISHHMLCREFNVN
jgi:hypothetical protein